VDESDKAVKFAVNRWTLAAVVACLAAFAVLSWAVRGEAILARDVEITRSVQAWNFPGIDSVCRFMNWIMDGTPATVLAMVLILILAVRRSWWEALVVAGTIPLRLFNRQIKEIVASPRPTADLVQVDGSFDGYGYPSGHTTAAVLISGVLVWLITRRTERRPVQVGVWILAIVWVVLTALARVRVGGHWPSDSVGSVLWAGPALVLLIWLVQFARSRWVKE